MKNLIHFFAISSIVLLGASLEAAIDAQVNQTKTQTTMQQSAPQGAMQQSSVNAKGATGATAFVSDQDLAKEIYKAIRDDRIFSSDSKIKIQVTVYNGKVTLSGDVKNEEEKARAEILATQINKLKGVVNNLKVVK